MTMTTTMIAAKMIVMTTIIATKMIATTLIYFLLLREHLCSHFILRLAQQARSSPRMGSGGSADHDETKYAGGPPPPPPPPPGHPPPGRRLGPLRPISEEEVYTLNELCQQYAQVVARLDHTNMVLDRLVARVNGIQDTLVRMQIVLSQGYGAERPEPVRPGPFGPGTVG